MERSGLETPLAARPAAKGPRGPFRRVHGGAPAPVAARERFGAPDLSTYCAARRTVGSQIDLLSSRLEEMLRNRKRMRETTGYPTGHRLDLRRVMAFEADPRRTDDLWKRKTVPNRRRAAFSLLVDLSGSMDGEKAQAALHGTIVFAETLAKLDIPFSVHGFQDELIPFLPFDGTFDDHIRAKLSRCRWNVMGRDPAGTINPTTTTTALASSRSDSS